MIGQNAMASLPRFFVEGLAQSTISEIKTLDQ